MLFDNANEFIKTLEGVFIVWGDVLYTTVESFPIVDTLGTWGSVLYTLERCPHHKVKLLRKHIRRS